MRTDYLKGLLAGTALALALPSFAVAPEVEAEALVAEAEVIPLADSDLEEFHDELLSMEELLDADVVSIDDEKIGDVENILFSADGRVLSVIAEVGGFLELGDTHVNIPWAVVVDADWGEEGIVVPLTEDSIEDYSLFGDEFITAVDAALSIQEVEGDGLGKVETSPRVWRASELIGDYVRLLDGGALANYGYVDDIIVYGDQIVGVIASPDVAWGESGYYAFPCYGYGYGWEPGLANYDLPYEQDEIAELEPYEGPAVRQELLENEGAVEDSVPEEEGIAEE